jgi:hypothetical protein
LVPTGIDRTLSGVEPAALHQGAGDERVSNSDHNETARMPTLKVVFARPAFENQLIFRGSAITFLPKFLCVLKVVGDLVKAAK